MRIIITGAAGRIGREITEELSGSNELCLIDKFPISNRKSIIANLAQRRVRSYRKPWLKARLPRWMFLFEQTDVVIHLAANIQPLAPWEQVLPDNIMATYNVFEAAVLYHVPRVVFASSNWAVKARERSMAPQCYLPDGPKIDANVGPEPCTPYGLSKAFGETAGRMLVDEGKLRSFVAVRIGNCNSVPDKDAEVRSRWIGSRDIRSLLRRCAEAEFDGFHVVYGVSAQATAPYDLSHTRKLLAWEPRQNSMDR